MLVPPETKQFNDQRSPRSFVSLPDVGDGITTLGNPQRDDQSWERNRSHDLGETPVAGERASRSPLPRAASCRTVSESMMTGKNMPQRNGSRSQGRKGSAAAGVGIIDVLKKAKRAPLSLLSLSLSLSGARSS
jgi:hypothetical protein